jgi:WD40 repeat protein
MQFTVRVGCSLCGFLLIASTAFAQTPDMRPAGGAQEGRIVRLQRVNEKSNLSPERIVVSALAADPRGEILAVAGDDFTIRILDMHTMRQREVLKAHRDIIRTLAFDPDGDRLVSAGNDGQLILWKRDTPFERQQTMSGTPAIACVRFAPDGKYFAAVGFAREVFRIGRSNEKLTSMTSDCEDMRSIAFRDDGNLLAAGGRNGELYLYELSTGKLIAREAIHSGRIRELVFSPHSNHVVSVGEDGQVVIFDTQNNKVVHRIKLPTGRCFTAVSVDSQHVAVAGSDNLIRIINVDEGRVSQTLNGHDGSVASLVASGGVLFSGGFDATIRRWMLSESTARERIAESEKSTTDKK